MKRLIIALCLAPVLSFAQSSISPDSRVNDVTNLLGKTVSVSGLVATLSLDGLSQKFVLVSLVGGVRVRIVRTPPPIGNSFKREMDRVFYKDALKSYPKGAEVTFTGVLCKDLSRLLVDTTR